MEPCVDAGKAEVVVSHLMWILPAGSHFMDKKGLVDIVWQVLLPRRQQKEFGPEIEWGEGDGFSAFDLQRRPSAAFVAVRFQPQPSEGHSLKSLQGLAINLQKRKSSLDHVSETNTTWVADKGNYYRGNGVICARLGLPDEDELTWIDWDCRVWTESFLEKREQSAPWNVPKSDPCRRHTSYVKQWAVRQNHTLYKCRHLPTYNKAPLKTSPNKPETCSFSDACAWAL